MKNSFRIFCYIILAVLVLTACGPAATQLPLNQEATKATEVQPTTAPAETTLLVWDIWSRPEETTIIEKAQNGFLAAHPGVKIERVVKTFDDMKATAKLALSSSDGPDVAQINQGLSDMGALVKAGLLEDLTPLSQKYGWDKKISAGIIARNSFTADGKLFGQGNLYGVPSTAELIGVFYRKDKFQEYGLSVPKTFAEFETILQTLKDKGEVPIVAGDLGGMAATHFYAEILNVYLPDRIYLDNLIFGRNNLSWDTPEQVKAAAKLQEWTQKGYFTPGFEGISYDDQGSLFEGGQGIMMLTGSWWSSTFSAGPLKDKLGFFLLPPEKEDAFKMTLGGTSTAYAIRATSTNKELAGEYIDWMVSDSTVKIWADAGTVPLPVIDSSVLPADTMFTDLVIAWNSMNKKDEVGHYLDWATPTFFDTLTASLEELMAMKVTPEEFTQKIQADYNAYLMKNK